MRVEVFDDKFSIGHFLLGLVAGVLSHFTPQLVLLAFLTFLGYELVEFIVKYPREKAQFFIGDLLEYTLGFTLGWSIIPCMS